MDDNARLKIKVGAHEFEAEGPADIVQAQFEAFKQLVATVPSPEPTTTSSMPARGENGGSTPVDPVATDTSLNKIMRVNGRCVSLTVKPRLLEEAMLLVLYGQSALRQNDSITGGEVLEGLVTTGGFPVLRVDRLLEKASQVGYVLVAGEHRAKRYRLTNMGLAKARQVASELIALVP
jgi:hypothetical protein